MGRVIRAKELHLKEIKLVLFTLCILLFNNWMGLSIQGLNKLYRKFIEVILRKQGDKCNA